jgi:hypothetical protein
MNIYVFEDFMFDLSKFPFWVHSSLRNVIIL